MQGSAQKRAHRGEQSIDRIDRRGEGQPLGDGFRRHVGDDGRAIHAVSQLPGTRPLRPELRANCALGKLGQIGQRAQTEQAQLPPHLHRDRQVLD